MCTISSSQAQLWVQGTIIVIIGVIGIVAFGSINSGLATETSAHHLTYLWTRGNWLGYFFFMAFALILVSIFTSQLDAVLVARSDLSAVPFSSMSNPPSALRSRNIFRRLMGLWNYAMFQVRYYLETWTAAHDDKRIAWTLGIGWACLGGGLAGGCLVFAKAAYVVYMLSHIPKLTSSAVSSSFPGVYLTRTPEISSDRRLRYSRSSCWP